MAEGMAEGEAKGKAEGKTAGIYSAVTILIEKQRLSEEEACSLLNVSADGYREYLKK